MLIMHINKVMILMHYHAYYAYKRVIILMHYYAHINKVIILMHYHAYYAYKQSYHTYALLHI